MNHSKVLVVEDHEDLIFTLKSVLKKEGYTVFTADNGEDAVKIIHNELIDLVLLDLKIPKLSGLEVLQKIKEYDPEVIIIMMTATKDARPAIEALKMGAYDYLMKPFELDELRQLLRNALETHQLRREVARLKLTQDGSKPIQAIYGESEGIKKVRQLIQIVAETPRTSILIQGESGTGKELVANAVYECSARSIQPFVKLNCAAIPENLLESELFGHEKGAFTDAKAMKKGLFELADGGTLFLDEISSMRLNLQPKILRVIENQTFRRIGGTSDIKIDVRVIAATNTDLAEMVRNKEFRDDLYYRLKVMEIILPPLRERPEDILLLSKLFLEQFNREFHRNIHRLASETEELLLGYAWPGNVRELKNVMERGVILCQENILKPDHLPIELKKETEPAASNDFLGKISLGEMEKRHILEVLKRVDGNKSQAAKVLDISRSTLREKLKLYE
jgi:DNA-binding NtrC family response regulator